MQATHTLDFPREDVTAVRIAHGCAVSGTSAGALRTHACISGAILHSHKLPRACAVPAIAVLPAAAGLHAEAASKDASSDSSGQNACVLAASFSRVRAYAFANGAALGEFEPHADEVCAMSWADGSWCSSGAPSGGLSTTLYTASHDTTVKAWPVSGERWPWQAGTLPLFELDAPDASVPLACEVRASPFTLDMHCAPPQYTRHYTHVGAGLARISLQIGAVTVTCTHCES